MNKGVQLKDDTGNIYPCPYYPVGSIYISVMNTNPSTFFGGVWERFANGRVLVGVDENQSEFKTVNKTGGNKNLQSHNHGFSANTNITGGHNHGLTTAVWYNSEGRWDDGGIYGTYNSTTHGQYRVTDWSGEHSHSVSGTTGNAGSGDSGNLQPYIAVYMWRRVS